jgi:cytochrome c2
MEDWNMNRTLAAGLAAAILTGMASHVSAQEMGDPKKGAMLAQTICSECHAVQTGQSRSPNSKAPTFANVAGAPGMTETALRVWLQTPHPTMPNIALTNDEKDDVIAYILSLKVR